MKLKKGTIPLILGLLLIAAALGLWGYNLWIDQQAGSASFDAIQELESLMPPREEKPAAAQETVPGVLDYDDMPDYLLYPEKEMPEKEIRGRLYIGVLEILALELELPIISWWSGDGLQAAPCRYTGSAYLDNLVIAAHNYPHHFGKLRQLHMGDDVIFTDMDGNVFRYRVASQELLHPDDFEAMTESEWPLTLFTCTVGGSYRVTVRCEKAE